MVPFLNRIASWKTLIGLFIIYILFPMVWFKNAGDKISELAGKNMGPIDLTFGYNANRTMQMVTDYGEQGRIYYKHVEMTIDILYPIVYALLFAIMLIMIYRKLVTISVQYVILFPFLAMGFDFLENIAIIAMLNQYPEQSILLATLCEIVKMMKWLMFGFTIFLIFFGLIQHVFRRMRI